MNTDNSLLTFICLLVLRSFQVVTARHDRFTFVLKAICDLVISSFLVKSFSKLRPLTS